MSRFRPILAEIHHITVEQARQLIRLAGQRLSINADGFETSASVADAVMANAGGAAICGRMIEASLDDFGARGGSPD